MSTTATASPPTVSINPHAEVHLYCSKCEPTGRVALCSARLKGIPATVDELACPVCAVLAVQPCAAGHG